VRTGRDEEAARFVHARTHDRKKRLKYLKEKETENKNGLSALTGLAGGC
jgi:hypothetical protein